MIYALLQVIILMMRASLAGVLVAAGAAKLADTRSFATTLMSLGVPVRRQLLIRGLAFIIPLMEVGVGMAIVSGFWPTVIDSIALLLMCSFSFVVIVALRRKLNVACRCFGTLSESQFSSKGLARSVLLTVLAAAVFWGGKTYKPHFDMAPGAILLLVAGFLLFGITVAQAAKSIAILKERMA
jgi:uncharacterized membrane protein YphA (DoxX/SURF4 family)